MDFVSTGPWASLLASLWTVAIVCAAVGSGEAVVARLMPGDAGSFKQRAPLSIGIGLTLMGLVILLMGSLGALNAVTTTAVIVSGIALAFLRPQPLPRVRIRGSWMAAGALVLIALSWLGPQLPPIGNDALAYHLDHPKQFIENGRITHLELTRDSLWPYQTEMLFLIGLLVSGTTLAQMMHWLFYPLTGWLLYLMGSGLADRKTGSAAAMIFLSTPAAFAQSGQAYVDLALAFYVTAAAFALVQYRRGGARGLLVLSGMLFGAAAGTKFLGLGAALSGLALLIGLSRPKGRDALLFCAAGLFTGGVWYVRSWLITGNPVYPFFHTIFGSGYSTHDIAEGVGMGGGVLAAMLFLWNSAMHPARFGGELLGPTYLMLLPVFLGMFRSVPRALRTIGLFSLLYAVFLFTQSQQIRFFLSVAPLWALLCGFTLSRLIERPGFLRAVSMIAIGCVLLLQGAINTYRVRDAWSVVSGRTSARNFLLKNERSYAGFDYLARHARPGEKLFNVAEVRLFYAPELEMVYDNNLLRQRLEKDGLSLEQYLDREAFDYLWLSKNTPKAIQSYASVRGYRKVFEYDFTEKPAVFHHELYRKV